MNAHLAIIVQEDRKHQLNALQEVSDPKKEENHCKIALCVPQMLSTHLKDKYHASNVVEEQLATQCQIINSAFVQAVSGSGEAQTTSAYVKLDTMSRIYRPYKEELLPTSKIAYQMQSRLASMALTMTLVSRLVLAIKCVRTKLSAMVKDRPKAFITQQLKNVSAETQTLSQALNFVISNVRTTLLKHI